MVNNTASSSNDKNNSGSSNSNNNNNNNSDSNNMGTTNSRRAENGRGGCGNAGFGRLSLRRILLHSPLLGPRLRSAAHRVVEGRRSSGRIGTSTSAPPKTNNTVRPSTTSHIPTQDNISEEEEDVMECPLCLGVFDAENFPVLSTCTHRSCCHCLRKYLSIEIQESRVCISCPECSETMHPNDIKQILDNEFLFEKYEDFMVRRVLAADPDTRWCPAPDCTFAVIAQGCASCPELWCQAPGCGTAFCYHCKAAWHPNQTCDAARRQRAPPLPQNPPTPQPHHSPTESDHTGLVKPCPRCSVLIVKIEDGSCNHMVCCVCGSEFCWLCMKEISDLHYLSPSGCTFWGKAPWSRKKKLLWQLGTLAGAPLGIALLAGVAAPALLLGLPVWAGRRARARCRKMPPAKRRALVVAAVAVAMLTAPAIATIAVGIGVPILLFYVYGVVPVSLCRSGGCGLSTSPRGGVRIDFDEDDDIPIRVGEGGSIAGTTSGTSGTADLRNKLGSGGSPSSGGARSTPPAHTGSIASQDRLHAAHRLEVTADVVSALRLSLSSEAASLSEPIPPDDASTRALAGSIRDYKQNQSETVSYSAADDCTSERVRFDDNVSIIGPSSNADFLPDALTDKHSICSSRSFRSLGKSSITEELSESLDKSSIGSGPRNVIFEENLDDINNVQESPNSHRSNSQSSLPGARRVIPKLTLKNNHKHFTSFEEDITSKTPPDVVKILERTDKAINLISKQNKASRSNSTIVPDRVVVSASYMDVASVKSVSSAETPETPVNEVDTSKCIDCSKDAGCKFNIERDIESGSDAPKRPLSKVAMLRNIFFHGSSMVDESLNSIDISIPPVTGDNLNAPLTAVKVDNNETAPQESKIEKETVEQTKSSIIENETTNT